MASFETSKLNDGETPNGALVSNGPGQGAKSRKKAGHPKSASGKSATTEPAQSTVTKPGSKAKAGGKVDATPAASLTKSETVLKLLRTTKGASITAMKEETGWQAHSVRGFLSATVRKKRGMTLLNEVGKDGVRRYRIDTTSKAG